MKVSYLQANIAVIIGLSIGQASFGWYVVSFILIFLFFPVQKKG